MKSLAEFFPKPQYKAALVAACFTSALSLPAQALTITPIFTAAYDSFQQATVNSAIAIYQSTFNDNVNININFGLTGGLGSSSQFIYLPSYSTFYNALNNDRTSANDNTAVSTLSSGSFDTFTGAKSIGITYAQCGALGLSCGAPQMPNSAAGTIGINLSIVDADRSNGITAGQYDMMAVVLHEIDEILGVGGPGSGLGDTYVGSEDLFRFTNAGARTFTTLGDDAYFSIDGGVTKLARFNQNAGGDYADWWSCAGSAAPSAQNACGTPGVIANLGIAELTALDVLGWNMRVTAVPEPSEYAMLLAGLGLMGFMARRRSQAA